MLRVVLDQLRAETRPAAVEAREKQPDKGLKASDTLWDRLGGEAGVTKVVDDFVNLTAPDAKVDFDRRGKYKLPPEKVVQMKRELVEQISQASGGPLKYTGPDMKTVHKGMGITDAQFNAAAANLKKALEQNNVAAVDVKKVLDAVGSYRKEIVEPKKAEDNEKKSGEKKEEKKEEKKPAGKASVQGKVTFQGALLAGGTVAFVSKNDKAEATIAADGSYKLDGIKPDEYKVCVKGHAGVVIPAKYGDPKTSGLVFNVIDGKQQFDIGLQ